MKPTRSKAGTLALAACAFAVALPLGWLAVGEISVEEIPLRTRSERCAGAGEVTGHSRIIAEIRNSRTGVDRLRKTIALVNSIPDSAIDPWLDEKRFRPGDGYDLTLFTRMLWDRRILSKPEELGPADKLAAFLKTSFFDRGEREGVWDYAYELIGLLAEKDPAALEAFLDQMPHHPRERAEETLLRQRFSESFETEIAKLLERPDGWRLFRPFMHSPEMLARLFADPASVPASWRNGIVNETSFAHNNELLRFWWEQDLQAAGFNPDQARKLRQNALKSITYNAPEEALSRMDDAGLEQQHIRGSGPSPLQRGHPDPRRKAGRPSGNHPVDHHLRAGMGGGKSRRRCPMGCQSALRQAKGLGAEQSGRPMVRPRPQCRGQLDFLAPARGTGTRDFMKTGDR